jgi:hypothetical protein
MCSVKIIVVLGFALSYAACAHSQTTPPASNSNKPIKLIYHVVSQDDFFVPEIEAILTRLRFVNSTTPLYTEVKSLNILTQSQKTETELNDYVKDLLRRSESSADPQRDKENRELGCKLLDYARLLQIKIKPLPGVKGLIFCQFIMFKVKKNGSGDCSDKTNANLPSPELFSYLTSSVTIDPSDDAYQKRLLVAIKKVAVESNFAPTIELTVNDKKPDSIEYVAINDTTKIKAVTHDIDTSIDDIFFEWTEYVSSGRNLELQFNQGGSVQPLFFTTPGIYRIGANAFDGISYSSDKTVTVAPIKPPEIGYIKDSAKDGLYRFAKNETFTPTLLVYYRRLVDGSITSYPHGAMEIGLDTIIDRSNHRLNFSLANQSVESALRLTAQQVENIYSKDRPNEKEAEFSNLTLKYFATSRSSYSVQVDPNFKHISPGEYVIETSARYKKVKGQPKIFKINLIELSSTSFYWAPYVISFSSSRSGFFTPFKGSSQVQGKLEFGVTQRWTSLIETTGTVCYLWPHDKNIVGDYQIDNNQIHFNLGMGAVVPTSNDTEFGFYYKWYIMNCKTQLPDRTESVYLHAVGVGVFARLSKIFQFSLDVYPKLTDSKKVNRMNIIELSYGGNLGWAKRH